MGRTRTTAAVPPAAAPARWAVAAAHVAALSPLLSSLWRLPLIVGVSMGMSDAFMADLMSHPFWLRATYLTSLGVVSEGAALMTLGLVKGWGEVFPVWLPVVGGRPVPRRAAVAAAAVGGVLVSVIFTVGLSVSWPRDVGDWGIGMWFMSACYLPLTWWGPLVLAVAWDYHRRGLSRSTSRRTGDRGGITGAAGRVRS